MRADRLREVAGAIERQSVRDQAVGLNMQSWRDLDSHHSCGTSACVAGFSDMLFNESRGSSESSFSDGYTPKVAARDLELTEDEACELFYGFALSDKRSVSPHHAREFINENESLVPDALRWMADTGTIDWNQGFLHACAIRESKGES